MTSKAVKGDDLLIADIWADEGVLSFLDSLNSIWNGVGTYEAKRDLLTGVSGLLHSSTISDDGVRDKVKGDRETCRFSADTFSS